MNLVIITLLMSTIIVLLFYWFPLKPIKVIVKSMTIMTTLIGFMVMTGK